MSYGFLYITTNEINGKKYLGMCRYSKPNSAQYLGSGKYLKQAIKKYGKDNFHREIIYISESREELSEKEIEFITKYSCVESSDWYNIATGGYATRGFLGKKHSEETKQKMKENHKQPLTEDSKRRIGFAASKRIHLLQKKITCPHCMKIGNSGPMTRWHFDKCRLFNQYQANPLLSDNDPQTSTPSS